MVQQSESANMHTLAGFRLWEADRILLLDLPRGDMDSELVDETPTGGSGSSVFIWRGGAMDATRCSTAEPGCCFCLIGRSAV